MKSGLGRITENTPQYQGVIVYSMSDLPLVSITGWGRVRGEPDLIYQCKTKENTPQYQGVIVYSMSDLPLVSITVSCLGEGEGRARPGLPAGIAGDSAQHQGVFVHSTKITGWGILGTLPTQTSTCENSNAVVLWHGVFLFSVCSQFGLCCRDLASLPRQPQSVVMPTR